MGRYLVLIYGDEQTWAAATPEWENANAAAHTAFNAEAGRAVLDGNELAATVTAVTLRGTPDGGVLRTDGPFLETKEVIGGYYLLEAPDLDEAVRLASRVPEASAPSSGVEVRPIKEQ